MTNYVLNASKDKDCFIIYMKGNEITQRKIHVMEITEDYVRAWCYLRNEPRLFRKENILSASLASSLGCLRRERPYGGQYH
jgi:predicted DNA-binding transcriptional regulator YafY